LGAPEITEGTREAKILKKIVEGAKDGNYKRLAILDTFHDFTAGTKKGNWGVNARNLGITKLKHIMFKIASDEVEFINMFDAITVKSSVENLMGKYLISTADHTCKYTQANQTHTENEAFMYLQNENRSNGGDTKYCVIHDAGVLRESKLAGLRAMTQARIFDPATASLQNKVRTNGNMQNALV